MIQSCSCSQCEALGHSFLSWLIDPTDEPQLDTRKLFFAFLRESAERHPSRPTNTAPLSGARSPLPVRPRSTLPRPCRAEAVHPC